MTKLQKPQNPHKMSLNHSNIINHNSCMVLITPFHIYRQVSSDKVSCRRFRRQGLQMLVQRTEPPNADCLLRPQTTCTGKWWKHNWTEATTAASHQDRRQARQLSVLGKTRRMQEKLSLHDGELQEVVFQLQWRRKSKWK